MTKISVVTTFNQFGYDQYGRKMINTFLTNWPKEIELHVYAENCDVTQSALNLVVHDFYTKVPDLVKFKNLWRDDLRATGRLATGPANKKGKQPGIGFKWDAVRFCHKAYAITDHAASVDHVVMWMDADTVCHSWCPMDFIVNQCSNAGIAYLGRKRKYSECGLYSLDMSQPATQKFIQMFKQSYDDADRGIFTMSEWHDSFVFDEIRNRVAQEYPTWLQRDWSEGIIDGEGHPLINSAWGAYLDHLKGARKDAGRSSLKDLKIQRTEDYWR